MLLKFLAYIKYLLARVEFVEVGTLGGMMRLILSEQLERGEEQRRYRQYLAEQMEEQKRQEVEMEQLIESELQQAWARREHQWGLEKAARDRLMKDVMDTRRLQIQEKCKRHFVFLLFGKFRNIFGKKSLYLNNTYILC